MKQLVVLEYKENCILNCAKNGREDWSADILQEFWTCNPWFLKSTQTIRTQTSVGQKEQLANPVYGP